MRHPATIHSRRSRVRPRISRKTAYTPIVLFFGAALLLLIPFLAGSQTTPKLPDDQTTPDIPLAPGTGPEEAPPTVPGMVQPGAQPEAPIEEGPPVGEEEQPEEGEEKPEGEEEEEEEEEILPLFGHDVFAAVEEEEHLVPTVTPPPPSYVLGPGDEVELRVWGKGVDYVTTIQRISSEGAIHADTIGEIPLAGKTISQARDDILAASRKYFPECVVSLSISELRSIEVMVIGDVTRPGRKILPGTATVFTALYAAGGPLDSGSLRAIDVRRGTELVAGIDLYDYLLRGETSGDITLRAGDTVFVNVIGDVVAVKGEIRRPARYEIGDGSTLAGVLDMSGGIRGSAYAQRIQVLRSEQNRERVVVEADLLNEPEKWRGVELTDGDEVIVLPVLEDLRNAVTVEGAVRRPDSYALTEGMTVTDAIERAEGLTPDASREVVHVLRESPQGLREMIRVDLSAIEAGAAEDVALQPRDIVRAYAIPDIEPAEVNVEGAVVSPGPQEYHRGMTVGDLVRAAGGLTNDAYGEAATLLRKSEDMEDVHLAVPVGKIMAGIADLDMPLENRDKLVVATREEKGRLKSIEIAGAVTDPDKYALGAGMTLSDLIGIAGGLLPEASGEVTIIHGQTTGASTIEDVDVSALKSGNPLEHDPVLLEGDTVSVKAFGGFRLSGEFAEVRGQVGTPGAYPLIRADGTNIRLSDLLAMGRGLLPTAYPEMATVYHTEESLRVRQRRIRNVKTALQESASAEPDAREEGIIYSPAARKASSTRRVGARQLPQVLAGSQGEAHIIIPPRPLADIPISAAVPVDLTRVLTDPGGPADMELQDGDILAVFERPDTVVVDGAVAAPGPHPYVEGATIGDYVWEAGRRTRDADAKHTVVVHYNGRATKARMDQRVKPGDWIIVPTKYITQSVGGMPAGERMLGNILEAVSAYLILRKL